MKNIVFIICALTLFSCSKNPHTDYKVEVIGTSERVSAISITHHGTGSQGNGDYNPYLYNWAIEFKGVKKSEIIVDAVCYDSNWTPSEVTIKIYRKNKLIKEGTGTGNFQLKYSN